MARCKECGRDVWPNKRVCQTCMKKWSERRKSVFAQAIEEIGPLSAKTLEAIQKRVKQLERELKRKDKADAKQPE